MLRSNYFVALGLVIANCSLAPAEKLRLLIIDGQNNHNWKQTTPIMKASLESSGRFEVDVATSPSKGQDLSGFRPPFAQYDVVLSNYNGEPWTKQTRDAFVTYMKNGGGFVCVHAANNSFPEWREYNEIIGLGGWGGRNESHGPYVYFTDGPDPVRDTSTGRGGSHGPQHSFQVVIRDDQHPITKGLPRAWMHAQDELYDRLRGPALNMKVLATAFSPESKSGRNYHEPMMMTIRYGKGRVFHTAMGHGEPALRCAGFIATLQRGSEWAATGNVTLPIPDDFPTADATSRRDDVSQPPIK